MIDNIGLGERVKEIRKELKLTQEEFGSKIGVQNHVIYNLEAGRNKTVNEPMLISLCAQYGINKDWLFYGKGNKYVRTKESLIDELTQKYNLNVFGKQIIQTFLEMSESERQF